MVSKFAFYRWCYFSLQHLAYLTGRSVHRIQPHQPWQQFCQLASLQSYESRVQCLSGLHTNKSLLLSL